MRRRLASPDLARTAGEVVSGVPGSVSGCGKDAMLIGGRCAPVPCGCRERPTTMSCMASIVATDAAASSSLPRRSPYQAATRGRIARTKTSTDRPHNA